MHTQRPVELGPVDLRRKLQLAALTCAATTTIAATATTAACTHAKVTPPATAGTVESPHQWQALSPHVKIAALQNNVWLVRSEPWQTNSLVVALNDGTLALADTPSTDRDTAVLLKWLTKTFPKRNIAVFNSHYHFDAAGGNQRAIQNGAVVYASSKTADLLQHASVPTLEQALQYAADQTHAQALSQTVRVPPSHTLAFNSDGVAEVRFGNDVVQVHRLVHAHSPDNVLINFPNHRIAYGGCAVRGDEELRLTPEANVSSWVQAAQYVQGLALPVVVPGHGAMDPNRDYPAHTLRLVQQALTVPQPKPSP